MLSMEIFPSLTLGPTRIGDCFYRGQYKHGRIGGGRGVNVSKVELNSRVGCFFLY